MVGSILVKALIVCQYVFIVIRAQEMAAAELFASLLSLV
jgi:hypothetical protein